MKKRRSAIERFACGRGQFFDSVLFSHALPALIIFTGIITELHKHTSLDFFLSWELAGAATLAGAAFVKWVRDRTGKREKEERERRKTLAREGARGG